MEKEKILMASSFPTLLVLPEHSTFGVSELQIPYGAKLVLAVLPLIVNKVSLD